MPGFLNYCRQLVGRFECHANTFGGLEKVRGFAGQCRCHDAGFDQSLFVKMGCPAGNNRGA